MLQNVREVPTPDVGGGLNTFPNFFALQPNQTPFSMNVKFTVGGAMEKRLGSSTMNATLLVTSAATGFAPDAGPTLSVGLQSFWKMDEQAGSRFDSFGSNTLINSGAVGFAVGILGNAANFVRGNSTNMTVADNITLRAASAGFTISTWVNLLTIPYVSGFSTYVLLYLH